MSFSVYSRNKNEENNAEKLRITRLTGDYYIFTTWKILDGTPFPANGMYINTQAGVILIDSPWDESQFQPLLDSIETRHHKKVIACIATHFHDDRTAGLEFFRKIGIKTFTSEMTRTLCIRNNNSSAEFYFTKDTVFTFGNHVLETFYPGEGHSPDNIIIWCRDEKIIYGGCLVKSTENKSLGNIADANLNEWPASIKKIKLKYPGYKYVIPGHFGGKITRVLITH